MIISPSPRLLGGSHLNGLYSIFQPIRHIETQRNVLEISTPSYVMSWCLQKSVITLFVDTHQIFVDCSSKC